MLGMPIRTTAIEAAQARGWSKVELARRTGLSLRTIHSLKDGSQPSAKAIQAIMRVFADLPYERLFVPSESRKVNKLSTTVDDEPQAA